MHQSRHKAELSKHLGGFTLMEIVFAVAVLAMLGTVSFGALGRMSNGQAASSAADQIVSALSEARSRTISSENSQVYGAHFEDDGVIIFPAPYLEGNELNKKSAFYGGVFVASTSLSLGENVIFKRISGETENDGWVVVSDRKGVFQKTVVIEKTGNAYVAE